MIYVLLATISVILIGLATFALQQRMILGALVGLQCAYLAVSYVGRPLFLLMLSPAPRLHDAVADARMASQGYPEALASVLEIALIGIVTFAIASVILIRMSRRREDAGSRAPIDLASCGALLAIGWAFRLAAVTSTSDAISTLGLIASVGAGSLLLFHFHRFNEKRSLLILVCVVASELTWSFYTATKAPIFAVGLVLLLVFLREFTFSVKKVTSVILVGVALLAIFPLVQEAKVAAGTMDDTSSVTAAYPAAAQGFIPVVKRFDLVAAGMDAISAGPRSWISASEALQHVGQSFVPEGLLATEKWNAGALWAIEVRGISVDNSNTGVHLAEGPIAEGYVIGGTLGVVFESLFVSLVTAFVAMCIQSPARLLASLGVLMLSQPYLFERGVLGISEGLGKGLQGALAVSLILWTLALMRGVSSPAVERVGRVEMIGLGQSGS